MTIDIRLLSGGRPYLDAGNYLDAGIYLDSGRRANSNLINYMCTVEVKSNDQCINKVTFDQSINCRFGYCEGNDILWAQISGCATPPGGAWPLLKHV